MSSIILEVNIPAGGRYFWQAEPGQEIIDVCHQRKLVAFMVP